MLVNHVQNPKNKQQKAGKGKSKEWNCGQTRKLRGTNHKLKEHTRIGEQAQETQTNQQSLRGKHRND